MKLKQFLRYFLSLHVNEPDKTTIHFRIGPDFLAVRSVEYDVSTDTWTVQLVGK